MISLLKFLMLRVIFGLPLFFLGQYLFKLNGNPDSLLNLIVLGCISYVIVNVSLNKVAVHHFLDRFKGGLWQFMRRLNLGAIEVILFALCAILLGIANFDVAIFELAMPNIILIAVFVALAARSTFRYYSCSEGDNRVLVPFLEYFMYACMYLAIETNLEKGFIDQLNENCGALIAAGMLFYLLKGLSLPNKLKSHNEIVDKSCNASTLKLSGDIRKKITHDDIQRAAVHESGHALVYAALGAMHPKFKISLNHIGKNGILGFVTRFEHRNRLVPISFLEWQMLVALAGKEAEMVMLNSHNGGSESDYAGWYELANEYFMSNHGGIYYAKPKNEFEHEENKEKIESLQFEQRALLYDFFTMNLDIIKSLSGLLIESRTLSGVEVSSLFSQVEFPENFPMPLGNFNEFSEIWNEKNDVISVD
jgi:hypothetical protein